MLAKVSAHLVSDNVSCKYWLVTVTEQSLIDEFEKLGIPLNKRVLTEWRTKTYLPPLESKGRGRTKGRRYFWSDMKVIQRALLVDEALSLEGRKRIAARLADYVLGLDDNPLSGHPERLPLRMIGDGVMPRYHDEEPGRVTLHGRGSLKTLAVALGSEVSELRFRSNVAIDGLEPWEEQRWIGRKICIGAVEFDVVKPKTRCLATHANPETGERDLPILATLTREIGQENPTFAVAMLPSRAGGQIHVGDQVTLLD